MAISLNFEDRIKISLSGNLVDVELDTPSIQQAFDYAKKMFIQRGNNNLDRKFYSLPVVAGTQIYTIPSNENVDTVIKFIKPRSTFAPGDPFSMASINQIFGYQVMGGGSSLLTYELGMQMLENIEIYTAASTDFIWKKRNNQLTLLDMPNVTETWLVECYANLTDAEYEDILWIERYALAEAKIILGRAYRKFSALTTPSGEVSLDGDQLVQEGLEAQRTLLESIGDYTDGDPTGGVIMIG